MSRRHLHLYRGLAGFYCWKSGGQVTSCPAQTACRCLLSFESGEDPICFSRGRNNSVKLAWRKEREREREILTIYELGEGGGIRKESVRDTHTHNGIARVECKEIINRLLELHPSISSHFSPHCPLLLLANIFISTKSF